LIVLVLPFKKWKLKCFSWQLVLSQNLSVKMSWVPWEKSDFSFCADISGWRWFEMLRLFEKCSAGGGEQTAQIYERVAKV